MPARRRAASARPPSITDVAAGAGVSIATVSRVLNGVGRGASAATAAQVSEVAQRLGYRPVSVGRALRQRQSRLVALLVANLANPAMAAIAASVETALRGLGLVMVVCDTHEQPALQDEYLLEMRAQLARAAVLLGAVPSPQLTAMQNAGERLVFVNRRSPAGPGQPYVGIDNRRAGRDVAAHFLAQRLTRAAIIHGPRGSSATLERMEGFLSAMRAGGASVPAACIATADGLDHVRIGQQAVAALLAVDPPPAAIFCLSDLIAYGARHALLARGRPDIVLMGFDDNPLNDVIAPWLSSVRIPYERFGAAVAVAIERLAAGEAASETLLPYALICRT